MSKSQSENEPKMVTYVLQISFARRWTPVFRTASPKRILLVYRDRVWAQPEKRYRVVREDGIVCAPVLEEELAELARNYKEE